MLFGDPILGSDALGYKMVLTALSEGHSKFLCLIPGNMIIESERQMPPGVIQCVSSVEQSQCHTSPAAIQPDRSIINVEPENQPPPTVIGLERSKEHVETETQTPPTAIGLVKNTRERGFQTYSKATRDIESQTSLTANEIEMMREVYRTEQFALKRNDSYVRAVRTDNKRID